MWQARLCLVITALIWGSTFIAQRMVADTISPTGYNGIRFLLGAFTLIPLLFFRTSEPVKKPFFSIGVASLLLGALLFTGAGLQQYAIAYTTAGKTAFITGLYITLVPVAGLFLGEDLDYYSIFGVILAVIGAGLMTLTDDFSLSWADMVLLISTLFWVAHILLLNIFTKQYKTFHLAFGQFLACGIIGIIFTELTTPLRLEEIIVSWPAIIWGGVLSVAIGFTGQLLGQRYVHPTEASLLMSLEMVFGALIGYLVLGETLSPREIGGVLCISLGVILAQVPCPWRIPPIIKRSPLS